jgi:hypothetical protein
MRDPDIGKAFDELLAITGELDRDIEMCSAMLKGKDSSFWRRTFVRALFAAIEGVNHRLKHLALNVDDIAPFDFTLAERAMLLEESYDIDDSGKAVVTKSKLRTANNLLFSLKIFARAFRVTYEIDKSSGEWNSFRDALKIRDRITHPKSFDDLIISDEEAETIRKTANWYIKSFNEVFILCNDSARELLQAEAQSNNSLNPTPR